MIVPSTTPVVGRVVCRSIPLVGGAVSDLLRSFKGCGDCTTGTTLASKLPVIVEKTEVVKSDLVYDPDIRQALHKSGNWYLIPKKDPNSDGAALDLESTVLHICGKSWVAKSNPDDRGVEKINVVPFNMFKFTIDSMKTKCQYCHEPVPDDIVGLWTLHNWDSLCEKDHNA